MREGATSAAILLGHGGAQQAGLPRLLPGGALDDLGLLVVVVFRRDLFGQEARRHVVEHGDVLAHPGGFCQLQDCRGIRGHAFAPSCGTRALAIKFNLEQMQKRWTNQHASAASSIMESAPAEMRASRIPASGMIRSM